MDTMQADVNDVRADGLARRRKEYSRDFKQHVVALTLEPGVSVSQVARQHGLNTNLLFTWRRDLGPASAAGSAAPALLPVTISAPPEAKPAIAAQEPKPGHIEIEIGRARMRLHGGVDLPTVVAVLRLLERGR
jgi:transposase